MVTTIPKVEPFTFQASTAFDERVQLADKLNEVIDALNLVGDIPDIQTEIDGLKQSVASLQESIGSTDTNLATVEGNLNKTISDLNALTGRVSALEGTVSDQTADIADNTSEIAGLKTRMDAAENGIEANKSDIDTIETKQTEHETEIQGLLREVVDSVAMSSTAHGTVQVTINHEDGTQDTSVPIDLGLVQEGGITLSTGATDRSFRLTVQLSDGSSWQTNDFVIPEGGGTEVVVTSVQIKKGSQDDMMKVSIGLSDGSSIDSNDWTFVTPTQFAALQSTVSTNTGDITSLTGRVTAIDSQLDTIDGSLDSLGDRVTALEGSPGYSLPVATASVLGGVKIGTNITVQADGTISIPVAGSALGVVKNGGNVTINADGTMNSSGTSKNTIESYGDLTIALGINGSIGGFTAVHASVGPSTRVLCFFTVYDTTNITTIGYLISANKIKGYIYNIGASGRIYYLTSEGIEDTLMLTSDDIIKGYYI